MADNRRAEAVDIVARGILSDAPSETWDRARDDPDTISREIWEEVVDRMAELVPECGDDDFKAAYDYLTQISSEEE